MKIIERKGLTRRELSDLYKRPAIDLESTIDLVKPIVEDIKLNGVEAAVSYAQKFDGFKGGKLLISQKEFEEGIDNLSDEVKESIELAFENIKKFHYPQIKKDYSVETMPGVICFRKFLPIENVGLYIPGGTAVLPSTVLMLGVPSMLAGCKRVIACTPVRNERVNGAVLYAAKLCGLKEIYKLGGAQAISLMAYGDKDFPKVDKIFGPGNQYVTAAKTLVSIDVDGCAIDMPAGPSEVLVIADQIANPKFIAADLLSQAEHGKDSQAILLTDCLILADKVREELEKQVNKLQRKDYAKASLDSSFILVVKNINEAFEFSNEYAPEHLILNVSRPEEQLGKIINAGSVFIGNYSPESVGDYTSGTNHSLPTSGYAKSASGVSVDSFMKGITFQQLSKIGLKNIAEATINLANVEQLEAHANAVKIRLEDND